MGSHQHNRRQVARRLVHECPRYPPSDSRVGHAAGTPVLPVRSPELPSGKVIQGSRWPARSRLYATSPVSAMRSPAVSPAIPAQKRRCPNWLLVRPHIAATTITMQPPNHGRLRKLASSAITDYPLALGLPGIPGNGATPTAIVTHSATRALACLSGEWLLRRSFPPASDLLRPRSGPSAMVRVWP